MHVLRIIFIALAFVKKGEPLSSLEKDHVQGGIDTSHDETGRLLTRPKRDLAQFAAMVQCETGRNPLQYTGYGCWCGLGGKGEPVDEIDRCCYIHDKCYDDLIERKICHPKAAVYSTLYMRSGCTGCASRFNRGCRKELCECDSAAARCFKENESMFQSVNVGYDKSSC